MIRGSDKEEDIPPREKKGERATDRTHRKKKSAIAQEYLTRTERKEKGGFLRDE